MLWYQQCRISGKLQNSDIFGVTRVIYSIIMHGVNNVKVINAQQARIIHHYKKTKKMLLKTNAAIRFNKLCRMNDLTP